MKVGELVSGLLELDQEAEARVVVNITSIDSDKVMKSTCGTIIDARLGKRQREDPNIVYIEAESQIIWNENL